MLSGELVTLRAVTENDYDALYWLAADLETWELRSDGPPAPLARAQWQEHFTSKLAAADTAQFAIDVGGALVGRCEIFAIDTYGQQAEVGISLGAEHRGRGYGTDAMRLLIEFAFLRRNLRRLTLRVLADNLAAIGSYRRVGFLEEGRLRQAAYVRGRHVDVLVFALLREEWQAGQRAERAVVDEAVLPR